MNIVVMMAGSSEEFYKDGNSYSKFLIEINGKSMMERVVENLHKLLINNNIIFTIRKDDNDKFYLKDILNILIPEANVVVIEDDVSGAAVASLLVIEHIIEDQPLLIVNGDQIIEVDYSKVIDQFEQFDAGVIVFESIHPRWSFVKQDINGFVIEAAEKKPISKLATAGFYFYNKAQDYIECTKKMILKDCNVNNIFYICPVFNEMILKQKKIVTHKVDSDKYHSLMSPKKVIQYEKYLS